MSLIARMLPDNPVLTKEMRVRMRGARAYWILLGYLGFLSLILLLNYGTWLSRVESRGMGASEIARTGNEIFTWLLVTQSFLVLFITPAITSGSITIEKEQRTLDMLTMTRLSRRSIITGKLVSAVAFTALLLVSSLPLLSICFMLGSVDPGMVVTAYLMMLAGSFLVGAMGMMWSCIAKTTSAAVLFTYGTLIFPLFFSFIVGGGTAGNRFSNDIGTNLLAAIGSPLYDNKLFGLPVPHGTGFALMCILAGLLFASIAISRLETWPERNGLTLRGLTLLFCGTLLLLVDLWWMSAWYTRGNGAIMAAVQPPLVVLIITAILTLLLVPIFATGDLLPEEARAYGKYWAWGWTPKALARGKMASGLPFLLLATLLGLGIYAFSFLPFGKTAEIARSGAAANNYIQPPSAFPTFLTTPHVGNVKTPVAPNAKSAVPQSPGDFPQAALVLLVSVVGFALLCQFFSIAFRNRWVALVLAYLFLIFVWVGPAIARAGARSEDPAGPSVNFMYFDPVQSLLEMNLPHETYWGDNRQTLVLAETPMWKVTTCVWLFVGLLSFYLSLRLAGHRSRKQARVVSLPPSQPNLPGEPS